jgi:hypothetical protein
MKFPAHLLSFISLTFFALFALADDAPKELVIDTTHVPETCKTKAATGDAIKVHYVRGSYIIFQRTWH